MKSRGSCGTFENLYSDKFGNSKELDKFLHAFDLPKLNQDISHLNRAI
jgi:hypothetical protein